MTTHHDDDVVDLGSVEEIDTAENLVLRDHAEAFVYDDAAEQTSRFRRLWDDLKNYKELKDTPYGLTPLVIISGAYFISVLDARAFQIAGPTLATDLQLNVLQIFSIFAIVSLFQTIAGVGAGYITDRRPRLPWLGLGTIFQSVMGMLSARANGFGSLGTTRVLGGIGDGAAAVPRGSLLADYYPPKNRGRAYAIYGMMRSLGQVFGLVIVGIMVSQLGFRATFLIIGGIGVVMGVAILVFLREPVRGYMERKALGADDEVALTEDEPISLAEAWRTLFGIRTVRRLMISNGVESMGENASIIITALFWAQVYGLDAFELSLAYTPGFIVGIFGAITAAGAAGIARTSTLVAALPVLYGTFKS